MKKHTVYRIWIAGAAGCILAPALAFWGFVPVWVAAAAIVCLFPVTVLALFAWWMAGQSGGDIPFIGY